MTTSFHADYPTFVSDAIDSDKINATAYPHLKKNFELKQNFEQKKRDEMGYIDSVNMQQRTWVEVTVMAVGVLGMLYANKKMLW